MDSEDLSTLCLLAAAVFSVLTRDKNVFWTRIAAIPVAAGFSVLTGMLLDAPLGEMLTGIFYFGVIFVVAHITYLRK